MADPLLVVDRVSKVFSTRSGPRRAVRDVSFSLTRGHTVGLVGESGSGKSTVARLALGLLKPSSGIVRFDGIDLAGAKIKALRRRMQMVFQDPYGSLLPHVTALSNVAEPLRVHGIGDAVSRRAVALRMLERVGVRAADLYLRQFSGGQQQRIAIARALVLEPDLLVCDEPTSSLDVSVQAQILALLKDLQDDLGLTCLFISHDLAVVERMATEVVVMCRGLVVESAPAAELFARPAHPYTRRLLASTLPVSGAAPVFKNDVTWSSDSLDRDDLVLAEISPRHYVLTLP